MQYKMLPPEFDKGGFHFTEILNDGIYKIYEKSNGSHKGYEVVRSRFHDGYCIAGVFIEPAQSMPGSEEWGVHGFTFLSDEKEKAIAKLQWMKNEQFKGSESIQLEPKTNNNIIPENKIKSGRGRGRKAIYKKCLFENCENQLMTGEFQRHKGLCENHRQK